MGEITERGSALSLVGAAANVTLWLWGSSVLVSFCSSQHHHTVSFDQPVIIGSKSTVDCVSDTALCTILNERDGENDTQKESTTLD